MRRYVIKTDRRLEALRLVLLAVAYGVVVSFAFLISKQAHAQTVGTGGFTQCASQGGACTFPAGALAMEFRRFGRSHWCDYFADPMTCTVSEPGALVSSQLVSAADYANAYPGGLDCSGSYPSPDGMTWTPDDSTACDSRGLFAVEPGASAPAASASGALATEATAENLVTVGSAVAVGLLVALFSLGFSAGKGIV